MSYSVFPSFPRFSKILPYQVLHCSFLIFHVFECFSINFTSYTVCFPFSNFFSFLAIFQVLQVCISPFPRFRVLPAILQVNDCFCLIFHVFSVFLSYSTSWSVCFSLSMIFLFSHHNQGPTGCISHFPPFLCSLPYLTSKRACFSFSMIFSFLTIIKVLQGAFLIFHLFSVPQHISHPTVCVSHFHDF